MKSCLWKAGSKIAVGAFAFVSLVTANAQTPGDSALDAIARSLAGVSHLFGCQTRNREDQLVDLAS
jgi:hypothetical protein